MILFFAMLLFSQPGHSQSELGAEVYKIFETTCYRCHGMPGERPRGGFDYVLDFDKLRTSPLVNLADPKSSVLYDVVATDYMPYEGQPLSADDKDLILRWISQGLPAPAGVSQPDQRPLSDTEINTLIDADLAQQPSSRRRGL